MTISPSSSDAERPEANREVGPSQGSSGANSLKSADTLTLQMIIDAKQRLVDNKVPPLGDQDRIVLTWTQFQSQFECI